MKNILNSLFEYKTLSAVQSQQLFRGIVAGKYNEAQIASLMTVFLMRNISIEELAGFRNALLEFSTPIDFGDNNYIDIVGTGGDGKDTFNISTCSAVVVAAAGYRVVKHGNYGASSVSGASNVMEQHGVQFSSNLDQYRRSLDECNLAYLHAPIFNTAMKQVATVRKNLGIRNFFNMLGPMINPASPRYQLLGTYNLAMQRLYCYMFQRDEINFAVVHSLDGYDEISLTSPFKVVTPSKERIYTPEELGFTPSRQEELFGGSSVESAAEIFDKVLNGTASIYQQNCVVANAAFAINLIEPHLSIEQAIDKATQAIKSGAAKACFQKFINLNS